MGRHPWFGFGGRAHWFWPALAVTLSVVPVAGVFTLSKVFFVRDLSFVFWPRYLWLRRTLLDGDWPLWDPSTGGGQSVVADALYQLFLLPSLAVRLIGPEVVSFNLWVALPLPLAALGAYGFFRRHASAPGAALGATIFAMSGPVVSTANFPNLSWSAAFIPWVLWATDRCAAGPAAGRVAVLAALVAMQHLSGEPVTMAATAAVAVAYGALAVPLEGPERRSRASLVLLIVAALVAGSLLAAVQMLPLLTAAMGSARAAQEAKNFWSLHPLMLLETVMPHLFGNYFTSFLRSLPWMPALNSGRDPFYYSLYVGCGALSLALVGAFTSRSRRWAFFWGLVAAASLVAALGDYTPVYPAARRLLPALGTLRFPTKYLLITAMALAALAVAGWNTVESGRAGLPAGAGRRAGWLAGGIIIAGAMGTYAIAALTMVAPAVAARAFYELAKAVGVGDPVAAAAFLLDTLPALATRLFLLAAASAGLLWLGFSARPERRLAGPILYALVVADLVVTNAGVNPTLPASLLGPPAWVSAMPASDDARVYYGGRLAGWVDPSDIDAPKRWVVPAARSAIEGRAVVNAQLGLTPSPWGVREIISYDLPGLWPKEYEQMLQRFEAAGRAERLRFLSRAGVGYCVLPEPPDGASRALRRVPYFEHMTLYTCNQARAPRTYVVAEAAIEPDLERQIDRLFHPAYDPAGQVMLQGPPSAAAGVAGAPRAPSARILEESPLAVSVRAGVDARGGYLILLDSYAPSWRVEVDGRPAELLRANALFRAVRLTPGEHIVRFTYRPRVFMLGLALSVLMGLGLAAVSVFARAAQDTRRKAVGAALQSGRTGAPARELT